MTDLSQLVERGTPPEVAEAIVRLCDELNAAAGDNLAAIALFGGLARGRYRPGHGDVNLMLLLHDASATSLSAVAPVLQAARRDAGVEPFILTRAELPRAAEAFPTRFLDIQHHHVVLCGEDPFAGLSVSRRAVLLHTEQELRSVVMRLRRRFVSLHDSPEPLHEVLGRAAAPVSQSLAALLQLEGQAASADEAPAAVFERAAPALGLDAEALQLLARLRESIQPGGASTSTAAAGDGAGGATQPPELSAGMLDRVLATILLAADKAAILGS